MESNYFFLLRPGYKLFHKDTNGTCIFRGKEINKINTCLWVYRGRSSISFGIKTFGVRFFFCARCLKYAAYSQVAQP